MSGPADSILELIRVSAGYGRSRALFEVSLKVTEGSTLALIGPNGAGKTTLARVCSALVPPSAGLVCFAGRSIAGLSPNDLARAGLVHVPEGRAVFATLSVEENLELRYSSRLDGRGVRSAVADTYRRFPHLKERGKQPAGTLSGGEQRLLSLACALCRPPLALIVDEPTLGLDPGMKEVVRGVLREVAESGSTLIMMEQRVEHLAGLAERVLLLDKGHLELGRTS
ncbi:MAG: ABC transporter ATP-binding protein [Acidimicrobiales bacterium]